MEELNVTERAHDHAVDAILRGSELSDLTALYKPGVMLVTAPAPPNASALRHAEALMGAGLGQVASEVSTPDGAPKAGALKRLAVIDGDDARAWVTYLEEVTTVFAHLLGSRAVGVRQVVSDGPHCPRFHVDRVVARGVLHVVGACTEWLDEADVDRSRLGHAGGPDDQTSGLVRNWARLARAEPGTLAVFKGTAWPDAADLAVVHRSPPASGRRRIVVTLDLLV